MAAVRRGDPDELRRMLANDPALVSAHDYDSFGATALIHAAQQRDRRLVELLLEHGADINQGSDWWAGSFGVLPHEDRSFAEYLIERGATIDAHTAAHLGLVDRLRAMLDDDPSLVHARGGDGQFPLHFAGTREVVDLLLERGADLHGRDIDHESTAAQWQATRNAPVTRYLVERGAAADVFMLSASGDVERLERMLDNQPAALHDRITHEQFSTSGNTAAEHIYFYTIGHGATPLHAAASQNQAEVVRLLLARGADAKARGGYDDATPLHTAAWGNHVAAAEALLDGGADIDARSGHMHDNESIGWAIVAGNVAMVQILLERGAAVRPVHVEDARRGGDGDFAWTGAPLDRYAPIAALLAGRAKA